MWPVIGTPINPSFTCTCCLSASSLFRVSPHIKQPNCPSDLRSTLRSLDWAASGPPGTRLGPGTRPAFPERPPPAAPTLIGYSGAARNVTNLSILWQSAIFNQLKEMDTANQNNLTTLKFSFLGHFWVIIGDLSYINMFNPHTGSKKICTFRIWGLFWPHSTIFDSVWLNGEDSILLDYSIS